MIWQCFRFCLSFQTSAEGELLICEGKNTSRKTFRHIKPRRFVHKF